MSPPSAPGPPHVGSLGVGALLTLLTPLPVLQEMMLMSLSCMELQLDQWLLTKGRSSAGRAPAPCSMGAHFLEGAGSRAKSLLQGTFPRPPREARKDLGL